jgi:hypothetical protein
MRGASPLTLRPLRFTARPPISCADRPSGWPYLIFCADAFGNQRPETGTGDS